MKTAITGCIGSGKSFVSKRLKALGISVYDCDSAAKRLMTEDEDVRQRLCQLIGNEAYGDDGQLNKPVLRRFLLSSPENKQKMENIIHPAVARDFNRSGMEWMECAILFQSNFDKLVDRIICISAPLDIRIKRIIQRDNVTEDVALQWIEAQMSQEEVERRSDIVIVNDGKRDIMEDLSKILSSSSNKENNQSI